MRKVTCLGTVAFLVLLLGGGLATTAQSEDDTLCIPTGVISLEAPRSVESKRLPVEFPHSRHFTLKCMECHHTWKGGAEIYGCMAFGCHDLEEPPQKTGAEELPIRYYKEAFHELCIGCHKDMRIENEKLARSGSVLKDQLPATGPTGCIECHE